MSQSRKQRGAWGEPYRGGRTVTLAVTSLRGGGDLGGQEGDYKPRWGLSVQWENSRREEIGLTWSKGP